MAKKPGPPEKSGKSPKSKALRPDVQPIAPALAELLNPAINRGESGIGSCTGLQPPPDNSRDRRAGGEAAAHRARASTPKDFPQDSGRGADDTSGDVTRDLPPSPALPRKGGESGEIGGLGEAPQANYGTAATVPFLDPELARQLGLPTEEDDAEALARPPRSRTEALGAKATAEA